MVLSRSINLSMGEAKRQRAARAADRDTFFKEHPHCCFCGGVVAAEESDHVPARAIFADRQWPESYEFPSCVSCNRATRTDEEIVALLARARLAGSAEREHKQFKKLLRSIKERRPEVLYEMQLTDHDTRKALRARGVSLPRGQLYKDVPLVSVNGPLVQSAVRQFSRKLGLALYYKHSGKALPAHGALWMRWWTNWSVAKDPVPPELARVLPGMPKLTRNTIDLSDQFSYIWGMPEGAEMASFFAAFRQVFAIAVFVGIDVGRFSPVPETDLMRPFNHAQDLAR
jgi:hypothetical protein